ncbi:hypothetical protein ATANTOWER_023446 [Ataeniobius toweri]|uniref:Caveolin n=1 Tax=Ataeniobius toweri TaxID=208326 RepID=A0ABU7A8Y3_9TELE|nr:hypothetical protein [Ataeniobius toweri]
MLWLVMPMIQSFMMLLPSAQKIWRSLMDILITPLFHSLGKCLSSIQVQMTESDADTSLSPGRRYLL